MDLYQDRVSEFDVVVTCFFIDTSHFVLDYIETINSVLKTGGHWVNLGPLMFHYSGMTGEEGIELSWQEVLQFVEKAGFQIREKGFQEAGYCEDDLSMLKSQYKCGFFCARKKENFRFKQTQSENENGFEN